MGKCLEGRDRVDEVIQMSVHVLPVIGKLIYTLLYLRNIVFFLSYYSY